MATMKQKTLSRWRMTSLLLLTMSVLTALTCILAWVLSVPDVRYLILLDAGSVHTSVYTYRYISVNCYCLYCSSVSPFQILLNRAGSCGGNRD